MEKRILSVCLTACMLLTLMPSAFAADAEQPLPIAGMEQTEETSADARTEPGDEPQEPVPTEEGKGTQEEPFTTVAAYNEAVKGDALDGKDVYLTISRTEFKEEQFALTNVQTRPNPPRLHLTLTDCTFTGNTAGDKTNSSFMYLPNCQSLVIEDCTFDTGESSLKYGINWNLCGIQGSTVEIRGCTFTGSYEKNAIKLNQRNGEDDAAEDVKPSGDGEVKPATIASAVVADCTFSEGAKIQLGSQGKGENNAAAPSTGAFPVTISNVKAENGSEVAVELAYQAAKDADIPTITLASGDTFEKTEEGVLVAQVGETKYTSIDEALTAALSAEDHTLTLLQDETKDISIAAGSTLTIEGSGKTLYGTVNCSVASGDDANQTNTNLTLNNLTVDGDTNRDGTADKSILITSQNQSATVVSGLNLTMTNCTVQNSKAGVSGGQGMYLTNAKNLTIDGCTFTNCGGINYAIDLNLVAVQDAVISITNTRFEGNCGASGPIKVAERGTGDGTEADDITGARASVKSLTISGCTFNNSNPILGGDIVLGVTTKTGEKDGNDTGSFPVTIADNKTTKEDKQLKIKLAYTDDSARDITTDIGSAVVGDGTTDPAQGFTITATAGEGGAITPSGKVAVAKGGSQTFTVTADSGYSISDVTVDDSTAADVVQNDNGTYTVQNVTKDCTVHATFSKNSSSGGSFSSSTRYTVSVEDTDNGSVKVSPTRASRGTTVKPDEGYELDKLTVTGKDGDSIKLTDKGDGKYTFKMPASKVEVEAVFTAIETEPEQPESLPFTDVSSGEWYYDAVAYVYEKGLMDGTSAVTFDPGAVLTRAMTAQVLWNLAGSPAAPGGAGFTDVAADAWYAGAVNWAAAQGIVAGYDTGAFGPADALCWAVGEGLLTGKDGGRLDPAGTATRAEVAVILMRFAEKKL
ncbi:MAG: S-layer homology domain-containing protein [Flavonifractor plautii]|jgi:hypothetical protein|nr:S-layer homology domain-containing protein [Flavonifractor plautii]